ncbi:hypothetical protein OGM23_04120 [Dickeya fangzhongdai]|uniref:hypothetical protein n=1 Tax=Dickeya fangzhongdai TaxID=1778540 RepID=UPI002B306217|nr:hypothetical protein OGM23_04120 [Dickeya fangzhongdai]
MKAKAPDESTLMSALNLQDLHEAKAEDILLSELETSGGIELHTDKSYPVAEYLHSDIRIAIELINITHMRDLTNNYVLMW